MRVKSKPDVGTYVLYIFNLKCLILIYDVKSFIFEYKCLIPLSYQSMI